MARLGFWQGRDRYGAGGAPAATPFGMRAATDRGETALLLKTYEESGQGWFWSTDQDGRLTYLTEGVSGLLGADAGQAHDGTFAELFVKADDGTRTLPFMLTRRSKFEKLMLRSARSREERWWSLSGTPQFDGAGQFTGFRGNGNDVTEQRESIEHASRLAMYDALTGLPNRLRLADAIETAVATARHLHRACAIMLIDLDRFKHVNDTLGHPAGDALLKQVAARLLKIIGDKECVFRLGGDEFQVIVKDCADRGALVELGERIIDSLSQPYSVEGSRCVIGASIGVAVSPEDGLESGDLIRNADLALYAAKGSGRGRASFFSEELLKSAEERRVLEEDLRDALARGEIHLFYQPIVDARSNCATGVEALVRWHHPIKGPISPALFIPIAEEANLIAPLGEWVLRKACEDAASWPGKLRVAVNVSPIQFANEALPTIVTSALASSGLAPERLELEITEGVFLADSAETDAMFATLKQIGVRLALDDFGTGYSSLGYLRTAPFDKIKIDQSFVRSATLPGSRNRAIIAAIVALAEAMGMETTAEGVETQDQLDLIRELRVSHVQGYIYSKPVDNDAMQERLETGAWLIPPVGPARQRSDRLSMYRSAGAIFATHYRPVIIRNLSDTGALLDGLEDVGEGAEFILDLGEGQLVFSAVRRIHKQQRGIEFEENLLADGSGGLTTPRRVSSYQLRASGVPQPGQTGSDGAAIDGEGAALTGFRTKLGFPGASGHKLIAKANAPGTQDPNEAATRIEQLAGQYVEQLRQQGQDASGDLKLLQEHVLPHFGKSRADDLMPSKVSSWMSAKRRNEQLPPATVSRLQTIIGQLYMLAMQGHQAGGAADALLVTAAAGRRDERDRALTPDEIGRLIEASQLSGNPQLKYIVSLLILTGTRQRQLLAADWSDFDLDQRVWRIPAEKGGGKDRLVRLSDAALETIAELPRWDDCPHVIANPATRKPYRSFFESWDKARRLAGLADVEIDDLRHSCPTPTNVGEAARRPDIVRNFVEQRQAIG